MGGLKPGMKVLDVGCGVGGPAREIARFANCNVVGVNNNAYQIQRAIKHTKSAELEHLVEFVIALTKSGYKVVKEEDRCLPLSPNDTPWYDPIAPKFTIKNIHHTEFGHNISTRFLRLLEKTRILNKGTADVQAFLHTAAVNLFLGGQKEIFTPSFFTLAIKEESSDE